MTDNVNSNEVLQEHQENITEIDKDTIPKNDNEIFIPVKFNKEIINLDLEKASTLAQKGMKFDVISKDYEIIKDLAANEGKSVSEFVNLLKQERNLKKKNQLLEKCGGDEIFAEHILKLEQNAKPDFNGFAELKENFPEIKDLESLPAQVLENAKLKGTLLLDEYLRYRHNQKNAVKNSLLKQKENLNSSTGSQLNKKGNDNPETAEFLKGLWQK